MKENKFNYKLINLTALMLFLYITISNIGTWYSILVRLIEVIFPFIMSFTIAYAFSPIVNFLEKKRLPKWLSVLIVTLSLVLFLVLMIMTILPPFYEQLISLSKNLGEVVDVIGDKFHLDLMSFEGDIFKYLDKVIKNLGSIITNGAFDVLFKSIGIIGNAIVVFVSMIYFLAYMDKIRSHVRSFFKGMGDKAFYYVKCLDIEIGNYIKGLTIFMIIQFFEYSVLFKIVNHPNWLILGLLACVTTVIPYFGGLITNVIALILASVTSNYTFIGTLVICLVFPQLDGYLISPKVYGKTNNVNPLITIMAVSVGGTLAGMWGIVASLPIYLLIRTTYQFFIRDLKKGVKTLKDTI